MGSRSDEPRYRGDRPAPLWWIRLKYRAAAIFAALIVIFASYQVVRALLTGKVLTVAKHSHEVIAWGSAPGRFVLHFSLWLAGDALFVLGFCGVLVKLKDLKGPSADTRI